jgi:hypothetical protein
VPAQIPLGEYQLAVDANLKDPTRRFHQLELGGGKVLLQLGDQTGRPGLIVSDDAEFDGEEHGSEVRWWCRLLAMRPGPGNPTDSRQPIAEKR